MTEEPRSAEGAAKPILDAAEEWCIQNKIEQRASEKLLADLCAVLPSAGRGEDKLREALKSLRDKNSAAALTGYTGKEELEALFHANGEATAVLQQEPTK